MIVSKTVLKSLEEFVDSFLIFKWRVNVDARCRYVYPCQFWSEAWNFNWLFTKKSFNFSSFWTWRKRSVPHVQWNDKPFSASNPCCSLRRNRNVCSRIRNQNCLYWKQLMLFSIKAEYCIYLKIQVKLLTLAFAINALKSQFPTYCLLSK